MYARECAGRGRREVWRLRAWTRRGGQGDHQHEGLAWTTQPPWKIHSLWKKTNSICIGSSGDRRGDDSVGDGEVENAREWAMPWGRRKNETTRSVVSMKLEANRERQELWWRRLVTSVWCLSVLTKTKQRTLQTTSYYLTFIIFFLFWSTTFFFSLELSTTYFISFIFLNYTEVFWSHKSDPD